MTAKISASADGTFGSLEVGTKEAFRFGGDNSGQLASFRNKVINGGFDIWQRATAQNTGGYGSVDRFNFGWTGGSLTVQKGQDVNANPESQYGNYALLTASALVGGYIIHPIEDVRVLHNQTVALSFLNNVQSGSNVGPAPYLRQNFGSGGSANVDTTPISDTTVGIKRTLIYNLPSVSGKTIGTSSSLSIVFPLAGTFTMSISNMQLEKGAISTPFEQRPIGLELSLCQRYYEQAVNMYQAGNIIAGGSLGTVGYMKVTKRAVPTLTLTSDNSGNLATPNVTAGVDRLLVFAGGAAVGNATLNVTYSASAEL